ncbi:MAG: DNA polymerase III subunit delta [Chloroflexi bacterium]|nr:DNA polymerase III subunit delta [Chloroflexota bacterium]
MTKRPPPRVYIFHGDDAVGRARYIAQLRRRLEALSPGVAALNYQRLTPEQHTLEDLHRAVLASPFLAPRRLVHAVDPLAWAKTPARKATFLRILEDVPQSTALVLEIRELLPSARGRRTAHWLLTWARQHADRVYVRALPAPKDAATMLRWIQWLAQQEGGAIEPTAAQALVEAVGTDTALAWQEMQKLLLYADAQGRAIQLDDVRALVVGHVPPQVFPWLDQLASGQRSEALRTLPHLLRQEDPKALWNLLLRHARLLLVLREAMDDGADLAAVAAQWRVPSFALAKYQTQARRYTLDQLRMLHRQFFLTEARWRQFEITPEEAVEAVVLAWPAPRGQATHRGGTPRRAW